VLFYFYKIKWRGGKPPPHTHPLEKFLFKKGNDNLCELKGGFQCKEWGPLLRFLTMEMNERGKIKGPH